MNRIAWFVSALVIAVGMDVSGLAAQAFEGTGQEATELFPLDAGLVVFEVEHRGTGAFTVRLLDEQGGVVEELARATGSFRGSKAVRVPRAGQYLLDVSATGPWSVRRRDPGAPTGAAVAGAAGAPVMPDTTSPAYLAGREAAREVPTNSWFARGFVGGALAGPIGAAITVGIADRSGVPTPSLVAGGGAGSDPTFDAGFAARVRESRKRKAFIGGMAGSAVFLGAVVWAIQIAQGGEGGAPGGNDNGGGGGQFVVVPQ